MPLNGDGKFTLPKRGKTGVLYIPATLVRDSAFPIKKGKVRIKIVGDCLIISNYEGSNAHGR